MRTISAPVLFEAAWSFTALPGGTRVDWTWSFGLKGVVRLFGPPFAVYFRRSLQRDLARLKRMMEAGELRPATATAPSAGSQTASDRDHTTRSDDV